MTPPAERRDTRPWARELKFLAPAADAPAIRAWMRHTMAADPHGTGPHHDEYDISTIYFDTEGHDVFNRRGSFGRAKLRIRRYGRSSTAFLERKLRTDGMLAKRRTPVNLAVLDRLNHPLDRGWDGHWFHKRLLKRGLMPATQMTYHRVARSTPLHSAASSGGYVRVTMDSDLRVQPAYGFVFSAERGMLIAPDRVIVEVKFQGPEPDALNELQRMFRLHPQSVSKYRLGAGTLGVEPALSHTTNAAASLAMGDPS